MQWRVNIPPLTRVLLLLLLVFSVSYQILRHGINVDYTAGRFLALIPQWALFTPWVYFTATYSEQNIVTICIAAATIFYGGKYLERAWGSLEFGKFILLVTLLPNFVASLVYVFLFAISRNDQLAYVLLKTCFHRSIQILILQIASSSFRVPWHCKVLSSSHSSSSCQNTPLPFSEVQSKSE